MLSTIVFSPPASGQRSAAVWTFAPHAWRPWFPRRSRASSGTSRSCRSGVDGERVDHCGRGRLPVRRGKGFSGRFGARRGGGAFTLGLRGQGRCRPVADLRRGSGAGARRGSRPGRCTTAARDAAGLGSLVPVAGARGRHHPHARPLGRDALRELRRTRPSSPPGPNAADTLAIAMQSMMPPVSFDWASASGSAVESRRRMRVKPSSRWPADAGVRRAAA